MGIESAAPPPPISAPPPSSVVSESPPAPPPPAPASTPVPAPPPPEYYSTTLARLNTETLLAMSGFTGLDPNQLPKRVNPDDLAILLDGLGGKVALQRNEVIKQGIDISKRQTQDINAQSKKNLDDMHDQQKELEEAQKRMSMFNDIMGVFGVLNPMEMLGKASKELGGPESLSAALTDGFTAMFTKMGMDPDMAKTAGLITGGVVGCYALGAGLDPGFFGAIGEGVARAAGCDDTTVGYVRMGCETGASVASMFVPVGGAAKAAPTLMKIARVVGTVAAIVDTTKKVGEGTMTIQIAHQEKIVNDTKAEGERLDTYAQRQAAIEQACIAHLKKCAEDLRDADMLALDIADTVTQAKNNQIDLMGRRGEAGMVT